MFVSIGNHIINTDQIVSITFGNKHLVIELSNGNFIELEDHQIGVTNFVKLLSDLKQKLGLATQ